MHPSIDAPTALTRPQHDDHHTRCIKLMFVSLYTMSSQSEADVQVAHNSCLTFKLNLGGAYRDRTDDLLLAKQVLSQLS